MIRTRAVFDNAQRHEPSAFERGKSMSEQLREERALIEKSAIKRKAVRINYGYAKKAYDTTKQCNIEAYNFIKQYLNPRRLTWKQINYLLNNAGYKTVRGNKWRYRKLIELVRLMEDES